MRDDGQFLRLVCFRFSHQPLVFKAEGFLRQQLKRVENCARRGDGRLTMKSQLIAIVAALLVVGCGESQQSAPAPEAKPVEPVAEAAKPEPPTPKAPAISIFNAAGLGDIEALKQHIAAGTDVNVKNVGGGWTLLHIAADSGRKEVAELLIAEGADVNAKRGDGRTPLDWAIQRKKTEIAALLRKHGGKTGEELKAEGK